MASKKNDVVIVHSDDWIGLYKDGKLVAEGHALSVERVLNSLGIPHSGLVCNQDWLDDAGILPENLTDVRTD